MDLLGRTLDQQYQLVELVSQSNHNLVYKGFQPAENRYVAVKVLSPARASDFAAVQKFQQEIQLIVGLSHTNILPVYDYGRQDDIYYYVTRFIEGGVTLSDKLPLYHAPHRARPVVQAVAEALDTIHAQKVLHGNLKPSNILIDEDGQPLLTDFGAFQHAGQESAGNPYQSPEQIAGGAVDARTDVYALGVLLYHMLIGELPPSDTLPSPRFKRPDLPLGVEKVILKAMAQHPDHRFQSAGQLSRAFDSAIGITAPTPVVTRPTPPQPTAPRAEAPPSKKTNRRLIGLLGGVAAVLLLAVLIIVFLIFRSNTSGGGNGGIVVIIPSPPPHTASVTALANVNIRSGPGTEYDIIGVLQAGQSAEVVGRNPALTWWVIKMAAVNNRQGWVSGEFVSAENIDNVPVLTPPPLPTSTVAPPVAISGWRGEYFDNPQLAGNPVLVRDDPEINFAWGVGSPASEVPADNFSARWTIERNLAEGKYRLSVWADNGVRMWVDNRQMINGWAPGPPRYFSADIQLDGGAHNLRVEYFHTTGEASIRLGIGYLPDKPQPHPPQAVIESVGQATAGQPVSFSAKNSQVAEGSHLTAMAWDFGDGEMASGVDVTHTFNAPGTYRVQLTITDDKELSSTATHQITIIPSANPTATPPPEPPQPPTAVIHNPPEAEVSAVVTFDGSESSPGNGGPIVSYRWDFGDGVTGEGPILSHTYAGPGNYQISLQVTDESGQQAGAGSIILITPAAEPQN